MAIIDEKHKIDCPQSTLHNRINRLGFNKESPIVKPYLSPQNLNDGEYWTIFYNGYDWSNINWSDETAISITPNKYSKVWVHKDEEPPIKKKVNNRLKIHVWGCMIKGHKLIIHIYDKTMSGDKYVETLTLKLLPFITQLNEKGKKGLIFQQDNAHAHTCLKVVKFMAKNSIEVMFWHGNSPDLNPIENIWNILKGRIRKVFVTKKQDFTKLIIDTANTLEIQIIDNTIGTMNKRIGQLFSNNFDSIDY